MRHQFEIHCRGSVVITVEPVFTDDIKLNWYSVVMTNREWVFELTIVACALLEECLKVALVCTDIVQSAVYRDDITHHHPISALLKQLPVEILPTKGC